MRLKFYFFYLKRHEIISFYVMLYNIKHLNQLQPTRSMHAKSGNIILSV